MDVLKKIKKLMKEFGWTEYMLAKESGLSQSTVSNFFTRNTIPTIPTLEKICKAFKISLSDFFLEEKDIDEQKLLLLKYNRLNENQKTTIIELLDNMK